MSAEDTRAAEYRRQQNARAAAAAENERRLAGDPAAKRALDEAWEPVTNKDRSWDPPAPTREPQRA